MKEIIRSIAILVGLVIAGNLILLIPDCVNGEWSNYGATGSIFSVMLGLVPIIIMILLDLDIINVYSLPFSDIFDYCMNYVLYILVIIASLCWSGFGSSLTNAISFILTMFILIFPLYLFYDYFVRLKFRVKNKFINQYLFAVVCGGLILLSIGFSYLLAPMGVYLPGDMMFALGTTSLMDGLITMPTLYIVSIVGTLIYIVYYTLSGFIARIFTPKKDYKYATYSSPDYTNNTPTTTTRRSGAVKCCKNCRYFTVDSLGYRGLYCKLSGVDITNEYTSCDYFEE